MGFGGRMVGELEMSGDRSHSTAVTRQSFSLSSMLL